MFGADTHDIGKVEHPDELSGLGAAHEPAGHRILKRHGVAENLARFALTHAKWDRDDATTAELLVSLADKIWKGKRVKLWVYDFRTNQHFTLKQNPLRREHLQDFVDCYLPGKDRIERAETERFRAFGYDELVARDKVNLDITWLKDASLEDADALLPPEVIAQEIVEDLTAALREFAAIADALSSRKAGAPGADSVGRSDSEDD